MSRLFLITIFLFVNNVMQSQDNCIVLDVKGKIRVNNTVLKRGDVFSEKDSISFSNIKNVVSCRCENPTRLRIFAAQLFELAQVHSPKEYWHFLGINRGDRFDIKNFNEFISIPKVGIVDSLKVPLRGFNLPVKDSSVFYVRYFWKEKMINKKMTVKDDTLFFTKDIYRINNMRITPDKLPISLHLYNPIAKQSAIISEAITPFFIDKKSVLHKISKTLAASFISEPEKIRLVREYLNIVYPDTFFTNTSISQILY